MAEDKETNREQEQTPDAPARRKFPLKAAVIVLAAFCMQMAVVLVAFHLYRPAAASAAGQNADADGEKTDAPAATLQLVDLGTFNITQFPVGDPLNRHQLSVAMCVAVEKADADRSKKKILDQKAWIGQLVDEIIGPLPLDAVHSTNREPLKRQLKAKINERIGEDVAQEVVLRIQAFGP